MEINFFLKYKKKRLRALTAKGLGWGTRACGWGTMISQAEVQPKKFSKKEKSKTKL